ncbi:MAG: GHMP family kinase ATP-binding protein [Vibrio sp.]
MGSLAYQAFLTTLQFLQQPSDYMHELAVHVESTIPQAKGMASSTADIAATVLATARYFDYEMSAAELAMLCTQVEPTDSSIFPEVTLFDHHRGSVIESYGRIETPIPILVLQSTIHLNTADYHHMQRYDTLKASAPQLEKARKLLHSAMQEKDGALLGEAVTLSAIESQQVLPKPLFASLLDIVERQGLFGINVSHSGSAIGILYDDSRHDIEKVVNSIEQVDRLNFYQTRHYQKLIPGGAHSVPD